MNKEIGEVVKAGGWSLANAERTKSVIEYIKADPNRMYFVPSAPGVINKGDAKVTDLLLECCNLRAGDKPFNTVFDQIRERYELISRGLGYYDLEPLLTSVEQTIKTTTPEMFLSPNRAARDLIASRGEWVEGQIVAGVLDFRFIDPAELINFKSDGRLNINSYALIAKTLKGGDRFVIPGFYGRGFDGQVKIFPRDGSDVTGAVVARGVRASIYRNLTSADGVMSADPRKVSNAVRIPIMTFREYGELGHGGATVLHKDTILPVVRAGIPINVRHSELPDSEGTIIVPSRRIQLDEHVIGIASRRDLSSVTVHRYGMNDDRGVAESILQGLRELGLSVNHISTGEETVSVFYSKDQIPEEKERIASQLGKEGNRLTFGKNIASLTLVGQGIPRHSSLVTSSLFAVLYDVGINHRGVTQGDKGRSLIAFFTNPQIQKVMALAHEVLIEKSKR